jgi:hypothetical protein
MLAVEKRVAGGDEVDLAMTGAGLKLHGMEIEEIPHRAAYILDGVTADDAA